MPRAPACHRRGRAGPTTASSRAADPSSTDGMRGRATRRAFGTRILPYPRASGANAAVVASAVASAPDGERQMRYADGPTTDVEVAIAAPPERVWEVVADIELPVRFSSELQEVRWLD